MASGDEYEFKTTSFELSDVTVVLGHVSAELTRLQEIGVISKDPHLKPKMKIIAFEECT